MAIIFKMDKLWNEILGVREVILSFCYQNICLLILSSDYDMFTTALIKKLGTEEQVAISYYATLNYSQINVYSSI